MEELRPIWRSVFFTRRVLSCIVRHIWQSEEEFRESYKSFSRSGDDDLVKEMFNPADAASAKRKKTA